MKFEIKHRWTGAIVFSAEAGSLGLALEYASLRGAFLKGASLENASLENASLEKASLEGASLKGAFLKGASLENASLEGASLENASLEGASLRGAFLKGASLRGALNVESAIIDTGETLGEYIRDVVPVLLTAGGKSIEEVAAAWENHGWDNCPMAVAFGIHDPNAAPALWRHRVRQFVTLFDSGLLPKPVAAGRNPRRYRSDHTERGKEA